MKINQRIDAFVNLRKALESTSDPYFSQQADRAMIENPWFTLPNIERAKQGIMYYLDRIKLQQWSSIADQEQQAKWVGIIMAGNIPMVGFHDLLSVLISGHRALIKLSSKDRVLMEYIIHVLLDKEPGFAPYIQITERLNQAEALIATGSDNTARYLNYYFAHVPRLIRKNRSSVAVLTGGESNLACSQLGYDIFSYFGLGCRNISKLFVPQGYDLQLLVEAWSEWQSVVDHSKYANNYDYQKAIFLLNQIPFIDGKYILLTANRDIVSPISVLYYENYDALDEVWKYIDRTKEKIQCIVAREEISYKTVPFGSTSFPELNDYADGVDTLSFLKTNRV